MLNRFYKYNTENGLFLPKDKLLLAVSGGLDSVVLCHLLNEAKYNFSIAHCNFGLRGKESDEDEAFVEQLAEDLEVNIHIKKFDTGSFKEKAGISTQMAARELRYKWFESLVEQKGYKYILTAHHQNDLVETILLNLVRGTGIAGLHGIKPKSGNLVRPLLFATRDEILTYAQENKLSWREDSSNQSTKYQRNLLRLEVIPILKKINPNLEKTLETSIEKIAAAETIFNNYIKGCELDFLVKKEDHDLLDYRFLEEESEPLIILFELIRPYGFNYDQSFEILKSLNGEAGKKFISSTHTLVKDRTTLVITPNKEISEEPVVWIEEKSEKLELPWSGNTISLRMDNGYSKTDNSNVASLNYEKLKFPLQARIWKPGDSFQPLGMKGKKKVSDLLNDLKIPVNLKETVTVLLSEGTIVWVAGYRIDERYKAEENKKSLTLQISTI